MSKKSKSHIWRYIGIGLVVVALVLYFGNIIITSATLLSEVPGPGEGGYIPDRVTVTVGFATRELLIMALLILGVLLIIFG